MTTIAALLQAAPSDSPLMRILFQVAALGAIFYFVMIRPQQKQRRQQEERLRNLKRGDEVTTTGGIIGEVVHIKENSKDGVVQKTMDDRITIRSAESRLVVERGKITRILAPDDTDASTKS
jgi:preprotein translocase subunit YajC